MPYSEALLWSTWGYYASTRPGLNTSITRARFEELCQDLFRGTMEPVERVLRDAKINKSSVHEIVLLLLTTLYLIMQWVFKTIIGKSQIWIA